MSEREQKLKASRTSTDILLAAGEVVISALRTPDERVDEAITNSFDVVFKWTLQCLDKETRLSKPDALLAYRLGQLFPRRTIEGDDWKLPDSDGISGAIIVVFAAYFQAMTTTPRRSSFAWCKVVKPLIPEFGALVAAGVKASPHRSEVGQRRIKGIAAGIAQALVDRNVPEVIADEFAATNLKSPLTEMGVKIGKSTVRNWRAQLRASTNRCSTETGVPTRHGLTVIDPMTIAYLTNHAALTAHLERKRLKGDGARNEATQLLGQGGHCLIETLRAQPEI
jgi:hypothetical protein